MICQETAVAVLNQRTAKVTSASASVIISRKTDHVLVDLITKSQFAFVVAKSNQVDVTEVIDESSAIFTQKELLSCLILIKCW
jgi:hypothetical protein